MWRLGRRRTAAFHGGSCTMMARSIRAQRIGSVLLAACLSAGFLAAAGLTARSALRAQAPSTPLTTWNVTIVLPPRIVAGRPATLAALGVDGKLASGVKVDVGDQQLTTDSTGRAIFSAPASAGYVLAKASGLPSPRSSIRRRPILRQRSPSRLRFRSTINFRFAGRRSAAGPTGIS